MLHQSKLLLLEETTDNRSI